MTIKQEKQELVHESKNNIIYVQLIIIASIAYYLSINRNKFFCNIISLVHQSNLYNKNNSS